MLFSGIPFLYTFLPIVLLLYAVTPKKGKNAVLLLSSLVFYGCGGPRYLLLMIGAILVGYVGGLLIGYAKTRAVKKVFLVISIVILTGLLGWFKYADFFVSDINALFGTSIPLFHVTLPIGISFYTFQILSYDVDVYRGTPVQKNLVNFAAYVSMFPQLIAGPIVRYTDVEKELAERKHGITLTYEGIRRFVAGLSKKILLANLFAELNTSFRAAQEGSVLFYWMYALSYTLLIYFDFSGYSDMAIGLGKIFGFRFPENFDYPYLSRSVTEFWRRWHKTLGGWFRDYVYIPLGGNRVGTARWIFNILVVWSLTGLWHGAAWNFVFWGLLFAVLLVFEKFFLKKILDRIPRVFSHLYVLLVVMLSFVLFNAESMAQAKDDIAAMFGMRGLPLVNDVTLYYLKSYAGMFLFGIIGATPFVSHVGERLRRVGNGRVSAIAEPIGILVLLLVCTAFLADGSFNPFLYFRF